MKKFNTQASLGYRIRLLFLLAVMLLAAGCSGLRFAYNNGDTLLYWWLNAYIDVESEQSDWVKQEIDELFDWHRKTQLRDYSQLLATGQHQLGGNMTEADLRATYREIKARSEKLALKAVPELADLARSMSPEQIANLEKKFASNNEKFRKKFLRGDTEERQEVRYKKAMKQFELWFGDFNNAQESALRKASDARPLDNQVWFEERMRRQEIILSLLRKVHSEKLGKEATVGLINHAVRDIFDRFESPERKAFYDAYLNGTFQMILTAIKIATPQQKAHAQKRMQGWIDDFNALAADNKK